MTSSVELAFDAIEQPGAERRAVFLHGILGSGANLRTIARRFVEARPRWDAWLVDLRGHGGSPKGSPDPSLEAAAEDVVHTTAWSAVPIGALVGHSFGGKVALEAARLMRGGMLARDDRSIVRLEHVVTIDSPPGAREPMRGGDSALAVIEMIRGLPARFESKRAFVEAVRAAGRGTTLAQWLAMSTESAPDGVRFALDLDEIEALILDYFAADLWPVVESTVESTVEGAPRVHFVVGDRSSSWSPEERERARALAARTDRVTLDVLDTDHWVHAEDPDGLLRVLLERIPA